MLFAGYFVPYSYITSYASLNLHTSEDLAFYLLATTNGGAFIGRLLPGLCPKPFATLGTFILASKAAGISAFAWMGVYNLAGFVVFCLVFDILSGLMITLATVIMPALSPGPLEGKMGTRLGMACAGCGMGILIGSPIAGAASDTTNGNFVSAQGWQAGLWCLVLLYLCIPVLR